jgi:hypothetical protein
LSDLYEGGSKHVLKLKENDKNVILKMHLPYITNYDHVDSRVSEEEFTDKVLANGLGLNCKLRVFVSITQNYIQI